MMELLGLILCVWLLGKVFGLVMKMAWGTPKFAVSLVMGLASVLAVCCLFFAGGILILVPVALMAAAFGVLKRCL